MILTLLPRRSLHLMRAVVTPATATTATATATATAARGLMTSVSLSVDNASKHSDALISAQDGTNKNDNKPL
jgi:hypothetical protein